MAAAAPAPPPPPPPPLGLLRSGALVGRVDFGIVFFVLVLVAVVGVAAVVAISDWFQFQRGEAGAASGTAAKGGGAVAAILVPSADDRTAAECAIFDGSGLREIARAGPGDRLGCCVRKGKLGSVCERHD